MTLSKIVNMGLAAALATGVMLAVPAAAEDAGLSDVALSAETLVDGRTSQAIADLKAELEIHPGDPALLINLGIAHAQSGNEAEARANFEAAMHARETIDLETANGTTTDSRRLARLAIAMLDRGEFRPQRQGSSQFTLRD